MWTKKYCNNTLLQVKKESSTLTDFHLTFVTLLESFHPRYLANIKQGQIDAREHCERQVECTF